MSNDPKMENLAIEQNLQTIEKNNTDKLAENGTPDKDKLRVTYATQVVDTKIKSSLK
jgi:hypothetical protein